MRMCLYTNVVSPHQLPLAREIASRIGAENFRYVHTGCEDRDHTALRFANRAESWIVQCESPVAREWLETANVLLSGLRDFDLFERRAAKGLRSLYMSERWFKPPIGRLRLLHPRYFSYARRVVKMAKSGTLKLLPIGVHARGDFARIGVPDAAMETWGYFVEPSKWGRIESEGVRRGAECLRVMWCGRRIPLKRVDTIERAVESLQRKGVDVSLDVYSDLTLEGVREEMRRHDVFVLASNGYEGWGAVVSEALEEGMVVLGTYEAGGPATLLPDTQLFHCGDSTRLAELLQELHDDPMRDSKGNAWVRSIGEWSAAKAAERLIKGV